MFSQKLIDEKDAWEYLMKFFTVQKAYRQFVLNHQDLINEKTGRVVSRQGFQRAAWMYVIYHKEECWPFFRDKYGEKGVVLTQERYTEILVGYAKYCLKAGTLKRYLEANGVEYTGKGRYETDDE
jgi:hypothetical protein